MILIVGGAGYIGSHVNKVLNRNGYETIVLDNLVYGHGEAVKWGRFIEGDIADSALLDKIFKENKIDAVMHFSAFAYVGESVQDPAKYYINNVVNTVNLLEAMRRNGVSNFIFSSTCATFGEVEKMPIVETLPQNPINPYGRTKLMVERILEDYRVAYGMNYCVLRYFNAAGADPEAEIGELHNPETHLIPLILDVAAGKREHISVFGDDYPTPDGTCIRDYIHIFDLASAHILAMEHIIKNKCSDNFNLGNGKGYSVKDVIKATAEITGRKISVQIQGRRAGDPPELVGSSEKAYNILGWKPEFDLNRIIETAWRWHQKVQDGNAFKS